ncbi:hypothetical protein PR202_ga03098 [Eleusine coracana subsp. coracana]|uniref:ATP-cone domain-containing protein n=1 Tax=Eleusine coracana subsp. coracana TaxID=191504 RepID=A0AAV5BN98_ELECO|nr:hypothetical protein PR202_ga03098 [Eleusine coracana subsp. coracana]
MYVMKRDGLQEPVQFDKITARLKKLSYGLSEEHCDPVLVAQKVCAGVYKGVTTSQLDELAAETAAAMTASHPDYASLAARIAVSNLHKNTLKSFSETVKLLFTNCDERSGLMAPLIADDVYLIVMKSAARLDSEIIYDRDFDYDYFGFKTLERSYLLKVGGKNISYDVSALVYSCFPNPVQCWHSKAPRIGVPIHNIRATGSYIRGTNGTSNGIVPMLRVFNDTARYVDQGGGKRKGAFAVYLEPWHPDIFEFLDLRKNHGKGKAKKVVSAQALWFDILKAQIETGTPYMLYKDSCNRKSNQQNLGTIKSSNLCTEIIEYTSPSETAVCNLASIALPRFVREKDVPIESHPTKLVGSIGTKTRYFDFDKLAEAQQLNKDIFETIYYHALKASAELAAKEGPYETYLGSPVSKGILQPDMWNVVPSNRWNWSAIRQKISQVGLRNSLLVAPMPTASTSQILGNNECFEPYTSNIYSRRVLSGEFVIVNKHLLHDLTEMGLWSPVLKNQIIYENGSVQNITEVPDDLKEIYKTVWEIKQKTIVDMAVDRGCFIDQIQSLNIHMDQPNSGKLTSLHFHAWSKGLKTGMYYLRTRAAADAIKFTVDTTLLKDNQEIAEDDVETKLAEMICSLNNRDECLACGS